MSMAVKSRIIAFILPGAVALLFDCSTVPVGAKPTVGNFEIVRSHFLGSLWNEAHAKASIVSQDGGQSFAVPGGAIWAFGDTFKGSRAVDGSPHFKGGAVSCAIAFLKAGAKNNPPPFAYLVSDDGTVATPFAYFPDESAERNRIWPLGGMHINGRFYLYYSVLEIFGNGQWDFRGVGAGLARSEVALGKYERLRPGGNWRFPVEPSQVLESDGWLYLFGISDIGGKKCVSLVRVCPELIEAPGYYEFYTGADPKFSNRREAASALVEEISGQVSVAWNGYLGKYVMATSSDVLNPRDICLRVADAPYGPWSEAIARITVPETLQWKRVNLVYCAYFHPELFRENGRVMNLTFTPGLDDAGFDGNCEMVEIEIRRTN